MKPKQPSIIRFLTVCVAPALAGLTLQTAHAASATWNGGATTNVLNTTANWTAGGPPTASGDIATWNGTATGSLVLTWTGAFGAGFGSLGTFVDVTAGQTSSLLIGSSSGAASSNADNFNCGGISIAAGAGAFTLGDGVGFDDMTIRSVTTPAASIFNNFTNNSSNTATIASNVYFNSGNGDARTLNFGGSGDWQINSLLRFSNNPAMTVVKNGAGTLTLTGSTSAGGTGTVTYTINAGTLKVAGSGLLGGPTLPGTITNNSAFSYESSATQTISGIISGGGTIAQTAGNLILTGTNTYSGSTTITGGTLNVSGTGTINSSSGITVNGATAKYLHTGTIASIHNIALTQGTVGGTGNISAVTVADNAGTVIANGNGNSAALTIDNLSFSGDSSVTVTEDGNTATSGILVPGTFSTTPANGTITVNAASSFWNSGVTYNLIESGNFSASVSHFTLGTINGVTGRQAPSLVATASGIGLLISGDNPKWSGLDNNNWVVGSTGPNGNWKLVTLNTKTDYIEGDVVLFDDTPTGPTVTVAISAANVNPAVVNFNNSAKNYLINGPFGIASGAVNKNGTGNVTISSVNTYNGGTTVTEGTLTLSGAGTLGGTGNALIAAGGTVNLGGTSQTVGSLAVTGAATIQNGTLTAPGLNASNPELEDAVISSDLDFGTGGISKSGLGTLTLSGTMTYSGTTAISGGTLALGGSADLGMSSGITLGGGTLDLGTFNQFTNAVTISAAATVGDTITNGTIEPVAFTVTSTSGVATVSANIAGSTGITLSGSLGTLSLTGANTFTGPLNLTNNATVTINGGSNTGGGAITYNSFGTTVTINSGSYLTSGITSSSYSEFRNLNLNGGILEPTGNIFTAALATSINFNGGTLKSGNAGGVTVYDANNQIAINGAGATLDTTTGNITVGLNTGGAAALANPLTRLNGTAGGAITILGGNSLVSGIANNGLLTIQGNSTWNLHGVASSVAGLAGDGTVTTSTGAAVLTINSNGTDTYAGTIAGGGNLSLIKQGGGTQALSGTNPCEGDISVASGILEVINNSANSLSNSSTVRITAGGMLHLPNATTDVVASLIIDGTPLLPGTYNSSSPETTGFITGDGQIQVVAGFANWMSQFATLNAAQRLPHADPDSDGIPNLVEYAVAGLSPITPNGSAGTLTGLVATFTKRADAVTNADVNYDIEASSDLGATDPWTVVTDSHVTEDSTAISYTFNPSLDGTADFVRLKVVGN